MPLNSEANVVIRSCYVNLIIPISYPKNNTEMPETETIYGTKTYDPSCPYVAVYVKDNSGGRLPFRITDFNQIDSVGTWSVQARTGHVKSTGAMLFVGLSSIAPMQLQDDLPAPPQLQSVRSVNVYVVRQPPSLPSD